MNNIILIGMPGSGKSTVGVVLAKRLGYHFLDSDLLIQEKEGKLLYQLIEEQGEAGFLRIENRINASIQAAKTVIATGGSAVYGEEAMRHLGQIGVVVYLKLDYEELETRLGDLHKRGVVLPAGYTLADLYAERTPLYEKYANLTVECGSKDIRQVVEEIAYSFEGARRRRTKEN
ncbi:MAG: shikimate kinase [Lachnospiraceae bacterium]|nr:shikimate kinase [Lachnospiraceae bacterium]